MTVAYLPTAEPDTAPDERGYTTSEMLALTGVTYRQLDWWCRTGLLPETARGSGSQRHFTPADVETVRTVAALLSVGFTVDHSFYVAHALARHGRWGVVVGDRCLVSVAREPAAEVEQ